MEMENVIPVITHPWGASWQQPEISDIEIDDTHALMGVYAFNQLVEYSHSIPSGVYIGKMWKGRYDTGEWYLAWFSEGDEAKTYLNNNYRIILVVD